MDMLRERVRYTHEWVCFSQVELSLHFGGRGSFKHLPILKNLHACLSEHEFMCVTYVQMPKEAKKGC